MASTTAVPVAVFVEATLELVQLAARLPTSVRSVELDVAVALLGGGGQRVAQRNGDHSV